MTTSNAGILHDCEQGSPDWIALRVGKVTASRVSDVLATIKKGESASRRNYRAEILVETLTNIAVEQYVSKEMQWGSDQEPFARAAYELQQDVMVSTVGFAVHPEIARFGASPDGLVGDDGLVEIKCPNTSTHIDYLLAGIVPAEYEAQMLAAMACTGRQWCDFVSFDPRLPSHLQLFVRRFQRDDARIAEIEGRVVAFLAEVDTVLALLECQASAAAAPIVPVAVAEAIPPAAPEPTPAPKKKSSKASASKAAKIPPKPTWDDLNPKTGKKMWVNYAAYEEAKDLWLLEESLRRCLAAKAGQPAAMDHRSAEEMIV